MLSIVVFICVYSLSIGAAVSETSHAPVYTSTYKHISIDQEEQQQKDRLSITDVSKITITKELQSAIPYLNIGNYNEHRNIVCEQILMRNDTEAIGSITYYYKLCHYYQSAHILGMGIKESLRRKGYGTWLVKSMIAKMAADGIQEINLSSRAEAIKFYKKLGFIEVNNKGHMQYIMPTKSTL